jgi:hypothetical protein
MSKLFLSIWFIFVNCGVGIGGDKVISSDRFKKEVVSICQLKMEEFHSVFQGKSRVISCLLLDGDSLRKNIFDNNTNYYKEKDVDACINRLTFVDVRKYRSSTQLFYEILLINNSFCNLKLAKVYNIDNEFQGTLFDW